MVFSGTSQDLRSAILREEAVRSDQIPTDPDDLAFREALAKKLKNLLEKPLTPRRLLELEQTARLTRELLAIGADPTALGAGSPMVGYGFGSGPNVGYPGGGGFNVETFGATILKEVVALLPKVFGKDPKPSVFDLQEAIRAAKASGDLDRAKRIEKKLLDMIDPDGAKEEETKALPDSTRCGVKDAHSPRACTLPKGHLGEHEDETLPIGAVRRVDPGHQHKYDQRDGGYAVCACGATDLSQGTPAVA